MFCLIKNPVLLKTLKAQLTDLDFSDEFFQKSFWKINTNQSLKQQIFLFLFLTGYEKKPNIKKSPYLQRPKQERNV